MTDIHALSGAYAVDALDDLERAEFEHHLAGCDSCRDEVDSLREAGALLAETVMHEPPAALRSRVLADIATVRPLPPVVSELQAARDRRAERGRRWLPGLLAAAAVVTVVGVGGAVTQPWKDDDSNIGATPTPPPSPTPTPTRSAAERVRSAPDAQSWTHTFDDGAKATLIRSESLNQAVIVTKDLKPAPGNGVYQLWLLQAGGKLVSAGLMPEGTTVMTLEGSPATARGFGITVEPVGGSDEPTTEPIAFTTFKA